MKIHELMKAQLKAGEEVVAMCSHQNVLVVVTNQGTIYKVVLTGV